MHQDSQDAVHSHSLTPPPFCEPDLETKKMITRFRDLLRGYWRKNKDKEDYCDLDTDDEQTATTVADEIIDKYIKNPKYATNLRKLLPGLRPYLINHVRSTKGRDLASKIARRKKNEQKAKFAAMAQANEGFSPSNTEKATDENDGSLFSPLHGQRGDNHKGENQAEGRGFWKYYTFQTEEQDIQDVIESSFLRKELDTAMFIRGIPRTAPEPAWISELVKYLKKHQGIVPIQVAKTSKQDTLWKLVVRSKGEVDKLDGLKFHLRDSELTINRLPTLSKNKSPPNKRGKVNRSSFGRTLKKKRKRDPPQPLPRSKSDSLPDIPQSPPLFRPSNGKPKPPSSPAIDVEHPLHIPQSPLKPPNYPPASRSAITEISTPSQPILPRYRKKRKVTRSQNKKGKFRSVGVVDRKQESETKKWRYLMKFVNDAGEEQESWVYTDQLWQESDTSDRESSTVEIAEILQAQWYSPSSQVLLFVKWAGCNTTAFIPTSVALKLAPIKTVKFLEQQLAPLLQKETHDLLKVLSAQQQKLHTTLEEERKRREKNGTPNGASNAPNGTPNGIGREQKNPPNTTNQHSFNGHSSPTSTFVHARHLPSPQTISYRNSRVSHANSFNIPPPLHPSSHFSEHTFGSLGISPSSPRPHTNT